MRSKTHRWPTQKPPIYSTRVAHNTSNLTPATKGPGAASAGGTVSRWLSIRMTSTLMPCFDAESCSSSKFSPRPRLRTGDRRGRSEVICHILRTRDWKPAHEGRERDLRRKTRRLDAGQGRGPSTCARHARGWRLPSQRRAEGGQHKVYGLWRSPGSCPTGPNLVPWRRSRVLRSEGIRE